MEGKSEFKDRVEHVVSLIPEGRVMTYGQIAALCGNARAARIVGGIAHFSDPHLPWHRVVNRSGRLASGYPGGRNGHKQVLENEGYLINSNFELDLDTYIWNPPR